MYLESLLDSLKEWDSKITVEEKTSLGNLLAVPLLKIGGTNLRTSDYIKGPLFYLESRIKELMSKEHITEEFLVMGVLSEVNKYFTNQVANREKSIAGNLEMVENIEGFGEGAPNELITDLKEKAEHMKSAVYVNLVNEELTVWKEVTSHYFSDKRIEEMYRAFELAALEAYKQNLSHAERSEYEDILKRMRNKNEINIDERLEEEQN
ncbi:hypothetical protein [Bacillus sp. MUM 13]|uniref:hypothetical protein n=1 Tax=Bacillus sp. MUM 13 TaxID=1678001 RepID=UPI0008F58AAF|nr:hypothetical protein [Bacillus sp. MUM 13]OIK07146.1 hypothetical protein BIV59_21180 [Bacillus sp. MUM 13]